MMKHQALHPRDDIDYISYKNKKDVDSPALGSDIHTSLQSLQFKD